MTINEQGSCSKCNGAKKYLYTFQLKNGYEIPKGHPQYSPLDGFPVYTEERHCTHCDSQ
jgi:hypothetical protein